MSKLSLILSGSSSCCSNGTFSLKTQVTLVEAQGVEVDRIKKKKKTGKKKAEQEEKGSEDVIEEREGCKLSAVGRVR